MKLGILVPTTTKGKQWTSFKDTYLYNLTLRSYLFTYSQNYNNEKLESIFYIGYDDDDSLWMKKEERDNIIRFLSVMKNIHCKFISMEGIRKGHLTKMWNRLFKQAYDDGCNYFFQCGDDITFRSKEWVVDCITTLKNNNDLGLCGPMNNNSRILTQGMVSRKHMDIFGFLFPEEIINWCCDDWYNYVYYPNLLFPLKNHFCTNDGGDVRYIINDDAQFLKSKTTEKIKKLRKDTFNLAQKHKKLIIKYIVSN